MFPTQGGNYHLFLSATLLGLLERPFLHSGLYMLRDVDGIMFRNRCTKVSSREQSPSQLTCAQATPVIGSQTLLRNSKARKISNDYEMLCRREGTG